MRSDMSLTLDLETWVKIIPHILTKGTMQLKFGPDQAKWRENMLQTSFVRQTDGHISRWKDGQTDHNRVPAEWGMI